uniref:Uncharacterized protein n=1 Tax=Cyprinus carpio TaxID=7962 RepID=A0A8C2DBI3_CYPCA
MVFIPGGNMMMGTSAADGRDGESPTRAPDTAASVYSREFVRQQKYKTEDENKITQKIEGPFPDGDAQKMVIMVAPVTWASSRFPADGSANPRARVTTRMGNIPDSASDNLSSNAIQKRTEL